ncbi:hypothetical protein ACIPSQ_14390 [Pectobacterium parvum]|uniref:hypothetical protein n=1 Tax=Pectobacterium parvum TaxID=2778550 RepID=UPI00380B45DF
MKAITLNKIDIELWLLISIGYFCLIIESLLPSYLLFFIYLREIKNNIKSIAFLFSLSLFISIVDYKNGMQFFCLSVFIYLTGKRYFNHIIKFENIFSIATLFFILFLSIFATLRYGKSWGDILIGQGRLGFEYRDWLLNPNILGMLSSIACLFQIKNGKKIYSIPFFIVLLFTQSRGALLFLLMVLIFTNVTNVRRLISVIISLLLLAFAVYYSPVWEAINIRFANDGTSDRTIIWSFYISTITENFPLPATRDILLDLTERYGPLDNLYLTALMRFGIIGIIYCFYLLAKSLVQYLISNHKFYGAFTLSFMIYGMVESGPIHNLLYAITFSMALSQIYFYKLNFHTSK